MSDYLHYLAVPVKATVLPGIKDKERVHCWKLLFWSLFRRPNLLPMAIIYSIYGFHFRKVYERHI